jgi:hypothetical protein
MELRICEIRLLYHCSGYISIKNREKYVTRMEKDMAPLSAALLHDSPLYVWNNWRMPSSGIWRRVDLVNWTNVSEERVASIFRICCHLLTLVPRSRIFLPWRWRRFVPQKRQFNSQDLHSATSQKTAFFIVTAVKTSNPTYGTLVIQRNSTEHWWTGDPCAFQESKYRRRKLERWNDFMFNIYVYICM